MRRSRARCLARVVARPVEDEAVGATEEEDGVAEVEVEDDGG